MSNNFFLHLWHKQNNFQYNKCNFFFNKNTMEPGKRFKKNYYLTSIYFSWTRTHYTLFMNSTLWNRTYGMKIWKNMKGYHKNILKKNLKICSTVSCFTSLAAQSHGETDFCLQWPYAALRNLPGTVRVESWNLQYGPHLLEFESTISYSSLLLFFLQYHVPINCNFSPNFSLSLFQLFP